MEPTAPATASSLPPQPVNPPVAQPISTPTPIKKQGNKKLLAAILILLAALLLICLTVGITFFVVRAIDNQQTQVQQQLPMTLASRSLVISRLV